MTFEWPQCPNDNYLLPIWFIFFAFGFLALNCWSCGRSNELENKSLALSERFRPFDFNIHPFVFITFLFTRRTNILTSHWHIWFKVTTACKTTQLRPNPNFIEYFHYFCSAQISRRLLFLRDSKVTPWQISRRIRSHCYSNTFPLTLISLQFIWLSTTWKCSRRKRTCRKACLPWEWGLTVASGAVFCALLMQITRSKTKLSFSTCDGTNAEVFGGSAHS